MDSSSNEVSVDFLPYFCAYKDGRVERFFGTDKVPPCINSPTGVSSKDVLIQPENGVSARIFIPNAINRGQKLPLLIYFHGGGFLVGSPYCPTYNNYVSSLAVEANLVAVSVDYRLAPEHHVPLAYEDSWAALQWVASHCTGQENGSESWLKDHVDWRRVFIAGDSAGGNIVHNVAARTGVEGLGRMKLLGACLVQPFFVSKEVAAGCDGVDKKVGVNKSWLFVCPETTGSDDPRINPEADLRLARLGCSRVLVCLAERDGLREGGWFYYETLKKSGWNGEVEIMETEGEKHVFHLFNPNSEKAVALLRRMADFFNQI